MTYPQVDALLTDLIATPRTSREEDRLLMQAHRLVLQAQELATHVPPRVPPDDEDEDDPPRDRGELPVRTVLAPEAGGDGRRVNWDGTDGEFFLHDAVVLGGYRSCLMGLMKTPHRTRLDLRNLELRAADPNGPPGWSGMGTMWGFRGYGISHGFIEDVDVRDFFGVGPRDKSAEGHGFYLTLSPLKDRLLTYRRCTFVNMGGHAIYHTSSAQPSRAGNAPDPEEGGHVLIEDVKILNSDVSEARGAYAISLTDAVAMHTLNRVEVVHVGSYAKYGVPDNCGSRGLLLAERKMAGLVVEESLFRAADPSDRSVQVFCEGPDTITFARTHFDCAVVSINDPWGDKPDTLKTKKLVVSDCTGRAKLRWNGQDLGRFDELRSGEWTL